MGKPTANGRNGVKYQLENRSTNYTKRRVTKVSLFGRIRLFINISLSRSLGLVNGICDTICRFSLAPHEWEIWYE